MRDEFDESPELEMAIDDTDEDLYDEIDDLTDNDEISAAEEGYLKGSMIK
ncbi:TPA: hypothetical protein HA246_02140 [Candidatus Woesearchaeota archaeon]|nr:hypothetical protein [Candidatus Woesearchaeota archaeon]